MLTAADPTLRHELSLLVLSQYPLVVVESLDESQVVGLAEQVARDLSMPLLQWSNSSGLVRRSSAAICESSEPEDALDALLGLQGDLLVLMRDLHPYLDRPGVVRRLRELPMRCSGRRVTVLLSGPAFDIPAELIPLLARLELRLPTAAELESLLRRVASDLQAQGRTRVELEEAQFGELARALVGLQADEARRAIYRAALGDGVLSMDDLDAVLAGRRERIQAGSHLEWVEPMAGLTVLGGAEHFKAWVELRSEAFSEAARRFGVEEPRGLLLVGVPGTGKSLACRALAGAWRLPLLRLDPARIYDKFIGESEANLRRALQVAETMAPAVLWVDEIEKAFAIGSGGADAGLSQRILGTFLTWMQERPAPVFVIATANDVSRLPIELLRRGRFDETFFVDLPGEEERATIFGIQLSRRQRRPESFDLEKLAAASEGFSGAEIEGVVVSALYHAFSEHRPLADQHLLSEIAATRPLASMRPEEIEGLRQWGRDHAVTA